MNPPCLYCGGTGLVVFGCCVGDDKCPDAGREEPCEDCEGTGVTLDED